MTDLDGAAIPGHVPDSVAGMFRDLTGLPLALWILDRISGENRPLVPGLFERAVDELTRANWALLNGRVG